MKKQKNYNENDYQTIVAKKEKVDELINNYECFGWVALDTIQHLRYANLLEIEFERPHFINNKDELQFLQVNMECDINKKGRLERNKHSKSTAFGIILGLLGCGSIAGLILSILYFSFVTSIVCSCLFSILALGSFITLTIYLVKNIKKENIDYIEKNNQYEQSIHDYCEKARQLIGASDE